MAEYIEREAVLALAKDICVLTKWDSEYRHRSIDPLDVIELPAADVRPVVRCRDCRKRYFCRTSTVWAVAPKDDWFCADGERMADNG